MVLPRWRETEQQIAEFGLTATSPPELTVVIATYNERENILALLPRLLDQPLRPSIIVVDDNSPDRTGEVVREIAQRYVGRVDLVSREAKAGYGSAMVAGLTRALSTGAPAVVTIDADLSHDPGDIPRLVGGLEEADIAIGSRYLNGVRVMNWGPDRLLLSLGANRYVKWVLGYEIYDCTSGFRAYRSEVLRALNLSRVRTRGYAFLVELLELALQRGFQATEVPIVYTERTAGRSKMSRAVMLEAALRPWWLRMKRFASRGSSEP